MRVLQITAWDLIGQQYAGLQLHRELRKAGHDAHLAVWSPFLPLGPAMHLVGTQATRWLDRNFGNRLEELLGVRSWLTVSSLTMFLSRCYRRSELVHLHLIHALPFFNLATVYLLGRRRPLIWSLHDPWMHTGHCVYPLDCGRWLTGCGQCPRLDVQFSQKRDTTAVQWRLKRFLMHRTRATLVVASNWMRDMVRRSPILRNHPCHVIPYGLDLTVYRPVPKSASRERFGIPADHQVLAFRYKGRREAYKGGATLERALLRLRDKKLTLLVFEGREDLEELRRHFNVICLGWVRDETLLVNAYSAADLFVMPSTAEAFGMMAVEAMACGTPVIGTENTALTEVIKAPHGGLTIPAEDEEALECVVRRLLDSPARLIELGTSCRRLAEQEYDVRTYVDRHLAVYEEEMTAWGRRKSGQT